MKVASQLCSLVAALGLVPVLASADTINIGYAAFDVTDNPLAEIDLVNLTGVNSLPPDFPVTSPLGFTNLTLTVDFLTGAPEVFGPTSNYFTLDTDGLSFDGADIFNTATDPVTQILLTGNFSSDTVTVGGSPVTLDSTAFSVAITDANGTLADGDQVLITANTVTGGSTPEPSTYLLLGSGFLLMLGVGLRRSKLLRGSVNPAAKAGVLLCFMILGAYRASAQTAITLPTITSPQAGVSGTTDVWVTGSGFTSGTFTSATISISPTCAAAGTTTAAIAERYVTGTTYRLEFLVPASLKTNTYYVSVSGTTAAGPFSSYSSCSALQVTNTSPVLASCNPGSSMGILSYNPSGAKLTPISAYVPNGYWSGGSSGVQVVPIEGGGTPTTVPTAGPINSCSSNSISGESVCIDNYTGIYLIQGSTVTTTLTSGATAYAAFSGGDCENCTVAVNEAAGTNGQAVIGMGYSDAPGGSALQFVDLASNTLGTPVPMPNLTSEDILWDPFRNVVLSPDEEGTYDIYRVSGSGIPGPSSVTAYSNPVGDYFDSAAEDCTTQIALASIESYPTGVYISDFSQISTSGGNFTAPGQTVDIPEFSEFAAATDGIAVAPGSTHLAVITGEFGGNQFGALSLPATSGTGTPSLVDYVAALLPPTPDGCEFQAGFDPHTTTAYTSANTGKAYGVLADWYLGEPSYLAIVDLAALLAAPRVSGIYPDGDGCGNCVNTVDPSYDLVAHGVVSYVGTGNANCSTSAERPDRAKRRVNKMGRKRD